MPGVGPARCRADVQGLHRYRSSSWSSVALVRGLRCSSTASRSRVRAASARASWRGPGSITPTRVW
ncbi:hypothetical protein FVA95_20005 [Pseudonocardia sp. EV170527-09]|nr:hypothetical protein FVA95_20005 [Pseudonocardia sp. EV170527-09]